MTANIAQDDATVGVQAEVVHGDITVYQLAPDAPAENWFRKGVWYLDARIPAQALQHIEAAITRGYETDEVRFHRLLALLSGRTLRQLGPEELTRLAAICEGIPHLGGSDEWTAGLRALLRLLDSIGAAATDLVVKELDSLGPAQRNKILDHLSLLLEGPLEDQLWHRSVQRATDERMARDREGRAWTFFQPKPAPPRARPPRPAAPAPGDWIRAGACSVGLAVAVGTIGRQAVRSGDVVALLALVVFVVSAAAALYAGADWHFHTTRRRAKDAALRQPPRPREPREAGNSFTRSVDRAFDRYFSRYVPRGATRSDWEEATAGIRRQLRDELVEIYREQPVKADRIAWLIRYLVGDVRRRWENGTLTAYRATLRPAPLTRAVCVAGLVGAVIAGLTVAPAAVVAAPVTGSLSVLLAILCAAAGPGAGFRIAGEFRRARADAQEQQSELAARWAAYERWQLRLSRRPSDAQVAAWLECDRKVLVDETMRQYRLRPSQVIAHAFIEAPGRSYRRARVTGGPWRYTRYRLLLFLLTDDGVRQVDIDLDFVHGTSARTQRLNYRFDAVAAVRIDGLARAQQTFELTLVNGEPIRVAVTEASDESLQPGEDPWTLSAVAMDASGLPHTLNVLEGVAAEGKQWIRHQRRRADSRLAEVTAIVHDLIG
ncbi:hypothetical protein ACQP2P_24195 [Dactylosporangium sp. CA-139114]|uniref:hypothetical protein n=1 Tax=Dactylosporangium sp. CA-139114 TaxID=3239931 RepID=UPI003D9592EB